jgi:hypothetical protein
MTDPITARWPRPLPPVRTARETRVRDDATAAALRAYLQASTDVPVKAVLCL